LIEASQALGLSADEETLAGLFEEADTDGSGDVSWEEFLDFMGKVCGFVLCKGGARGADRSPQILQGDEALHGFARLIVGLKETPLSLLVDECKQRSLDLQFRLVLPEREREVRGASAPPGARFTRPPPAPSPAEQSASQRGASSVPAAAMDVRHADGKVRIEAVLTGPRPELVDGVLRIDHGERAYLGVGVSTRVAKTEAAGARRAGGGGATPRPQVTPPRAAAQPAR